MAKIKVLQANLQRKVAAHDAAWATATEREVDVIMASEPNLRKTKSGWLNDKSGGFAVQIVNKKIGVRKVAEEEGFIVLNMGEFIIIGCYLPPSWNLPRVRTVMEAISDRCRGVKCLILGDLNAKSPRWGADREDARGTLIAECMDELDMVAANTGGTPTWHRGVQCSYIDVTMYTTSMGGRITGWKVLTEESLSDHRFIEFDIADGQRRRKGASLRVGQVIDYGMVERLLKERTIPDRTGGSEKIAEVTRILRDVQAQATIRDRSGRPKRLPYWWCVDIEEARREAIRARRVYTRARDEVTKTRAWGEYRDVKSHLEREIRRAKRAHWRRTLDALDEDPWGKGYQIVTKGTLSSVPPYDLAEEDMISIARKLFPRVEDRRVGPLNKGATVTMMITRKELEEAADKLKTGKSPGPDGVRAETVKLAVKYIPNDILKIFNDFFLDGRFPAPWKKAKLILIWKGKMPFEEASSQRPICLLDTLGKLYEIIIRERLVANLEAGLNLSKSQFGFRKGRSTVMAIQELQKFIRDAKTERLCGVVTVDIRNAFNTARWSLIITEMVRRNIDVGLIRIIEDYFSDRTILVGGERLDMNMGVPQGSVLGPTLWNILYDGVLNLRLPAGTQTLAFADDLAFLFKGNSQEAFNRAGNRGLASIDAWMRAHSLEIAPEKTELIVIKGWRRTLVTNIAIKGIRVEPQKEVRYLGVWLDTRNTYGIHVWKTCGKAEKRLGALRRLMPNIGGARAAKRKLYTSVILSIMLYAAPVWHTVLGIGRHKNKLVSTQRGALLREGMAYRTVSNWAIQVITGNPPIELLIDERRRLNDRRVGISPVIRKEERLATLTKWQELWEDLRDKAQWTKRLIPNVRAWVECKHRNLNYHLTQFLSGHGQFGTYLERIKKVPNSSCRTCWTPDSPEHVVIECPRWAEERARLRELVGGTLSVEGLIENMLENRDKWNRISCSLVNIIKSKEEEERVRR